MKYRVGFDSRRGLFHETPDIEADSPKQAAEKYAGKVVRHYDKLGGEFVIQSTHWPFKMFIYDRVKQGGTE